MTAPEVARLNRLTGLLLGQAVGDALGLPTEGMSRRRCHDWHSTRPIRHRFVLGRGMFSDDAEHAILTAQAYLASRGDPDRFTSELAGRLRWWIAGLPAGTGRATAIACLRLWLGWKPDRSGVRSAGAGPAMRATVLGAVLEGNEFAIAEFVERSTRMTHLHSLAKEGALLIAHAAALSMKAQPGNVSSPEFALALRDRAASPEFRTSLDHVARRVASKDPIDSLLEDLGLSGGVSGYILHVVPVSLFCWLANVGDYALAVETAILAGGDTDTTGAITGALAGATLGAGAIPHRLVHGLVEWPRSPRWIEELARRLDAACDLPEPPPKPLPVFLPGVVGRNALFLSLVLFHALRRLVPP